MKGITLPCSGCKNILLRYANIQGEGNFEMRCPHCEVLNKVLISQKTVILSSLVQLALIAVIFGSLLYIFSAEPIKQFVVNLF